MLAELAAANPIIEQTFAEASEVLGYDLWRLTQEGPADALNQTQCTQPAMLAGDIAVWRVWQASSPAAPLLAAGHSLGEYAALVATSAVLFPTAIALVEERGRLMQEAVPSGEGAIAAIVGVEDNKIIEICTKACGERHVSAVNFNAPGQVAIAGHTEAVDRAIALAQIAGAKRAIRLPLSVPVHSRLMTPAAEKFAESLAAADFRAPDIPVVHNVDVSVHDEPDAIRQALASQVDHPVWWTETIQHLAGEGVDTLLELGPGKVLCGLARRIDRNLRALPVTDCATFEKALDQVGQAS